MKKLPIAKTEIREIIEDNFCYVDKTKFIKMMVDEAHRYYFLARPRRFGKSLLVDTMRAIFSGEKELFKGLYIENNWDWSVKYPVIKISFGGGTVNNREELKIKLNEILKENIRNYSIKLTNQSESGRLKELIYTLFNKYQQPVVVLIDEYDKPILDNITEPKVEEIRKELASFYSVLKDASAYLKFVFLTGVTKFSKTSIFSKLNNITDISLVPQYADICGYTQTDLEIIFADYLHDVDLKEVKLWYNGYNFRGNSVYNPYDVLMFLWSKEYKPHWFETGTPTFLLEIIKQRKFYVPQLEELRVSETQLGEFDINNIQLEVLLFQTGYLTIRERKKIGIQTYYTLKIPNLEVQFGFNDYLMNMFYASMFESYERTGLSQALYFSIEEKKPEDLHKAFYTLFAGVSHQWFVKNNIAEYEGFYCSMFYVFFASLGLNIKNEDTTNKGRIDFTVITDDAVFIFEIKMKRIKQNALAQIKDKKYHEKYLSEKKEIYLIGIEFDEKIKNFSNFEYEKFIK